VRRLHPSSFTDHVKPCLDEVPRLVLEERNLALSEYGLFGLWRILGRANRESLAGSFVRAQNRYLERPYTCFV
jgi:hypothetical protein